MRDRWTAAFVSGLLGIGSIAYAQETTVDRAAIGAVGQSVRVVGRQGERVPPQAASRISIARDELLVKRTGDKAAEKVVNGRPRFELPVQIIGVAPSGAPINLGAVVEIAGGGLRLRGDATGFVGQIFVGIEDKDNPTGASTLGRRVQFLVTANADSVKPQGLDVDHANLPYVPVLIETARPIDAVAVHVRPDFDPQGFDLELPIVRPRLTLMPTLPAIQGFGLETTDLTVSVNGASVPAGLRVTLSSNNRGTVTPAEVTLGGGGTAIASLRSSGVGDANLTAQQGGLFAPATATVAFVFPWPFVIAVVMGGAVGGFLHYALKGHRTGKLKFRPIVRDVIVGTAAGLLVATLYAVGINVLDLQFTARTGEALVFCSSAVGALARDRLVKLTGT